MKSVFKRCGKTPVKGNIEGLDQGASVPFDPGNNLFFFKQIVWMFDTLKWRANVQIFKSRLQGIGRVATPLGAVWSGPPSRPASPRVSHWYARFIFLTFSHSCLSQFAFVSAAGLREAAGVKGQQCCLRRGDNSSSPLIFMVLLLYCDANLMTTLRLFDKWVSLSCSAQDPVVRGGQIVWVWAAAQMWSFCVAQMEHFTSPLKSCELRSYWNLSQCSRASVWPWS